jgi:hypothetical protein
LAVIILSSKTYEIFTAMNTLAEELKVKSEICHGDKKKPSSIQIDENEKKVLDPKCRRWSGLLYSG